MEAALTASFQRAWHDRPEYDEDGLEELLLLEDLPAQAPEPGLSLPHPQPDLSLPHPQPGLSLPQAQPWLSPPSATFPPQQHPQKFPPYPLSRFPHPPIWFDNPDQDSKDCQNRVDLLRTYFRAQLNQKFPAPFPTNNGPLATSFLQPQVVLSRVDVAKAKADLKSLDGDDTLQALAANLAGIEADLDGDVETETRPFLVRVTLPSAQEQPQQQQQSEALESRSNSCGLKGSASCPPRLAQPRIPIKALRARSKSCCLNRDASCPAPLAQSSIPIKALRARSQSCCLNRFAGCPAPLAQPSIPTKAPIDSLLQAVQDMDCVPGHEDCSLSPTQMISLMIPPSPLSPLLIGSAQNSVLASHSPSRLVIATPPPSPDSFQSQPRMDPEEEILEVLVIDIDSENEE